ncbi:glycosyltransferase family 39 protein [Candidatus Gottesmanbacteria bacterium]|nr:glycosyltransferase family 39 protein [Candidatus Gottesmanbacteria bacterium]
MKNTLIVTSLLLLTVALRLHNYAVYPQRGATSDEYAFAFQGISLITHGIPTAWSAIPLYKDVRHLIVDGLYFPVVRPYLDHPPLFGLLIGLWAILARQTTFEVVRLATIRVIPIVLSLISSVFLYSLAKSVYGERVARWSLAIYATTTLFVVNSRIVVAESLVTPLWLAAVWMITRKQKKADRSPFIILGLLAAAAILTKVLGVVVWLSVVVILVYRRVPIRRIVFATGTAFVGVLVLYLYGRAYDEKLFWAIQSYQGMSRILGPKTIWTILGTPSIVNTIYYDGWYFWGLFAVGVASLDIRKNITVVVPAFLYVLLLMVSVNETDIHGWYFIPLFPFFALAGGWLLIESIENARWTLLVWAVLVGASLIHALYALPFGLTPSVYRWLMGIMLTLVVVSLLTQSTVWRRRIGYGTAILFIVATAIATLRYIHPT